MSIHHCLLYFSYKVHSYLFVALHEYAIIVSTISSHAATCGANWCLGNKLQVRVLHKIVCTPKEDDIWWQKIRLHWAWKGSKHLDTNLWFQIQSPCLWIERWSMPASTRSKIVENTKKILTLKELDNERPSAGGVCGLEHDKIGLRNSMLFITYDGPDEKIYVELVSLNSLVNYCRIRLGSKDAGLGIQVVDVIWTFYNNIMRVW